jgi:hypothetical protein
LETIFLNSGVWLSNEFRVVVKTQFPVSGLKLEVLVEIAIPITYQQHICIATYFQHYADLLLHLR